MIQDKIWCMLLQVLHKCSVTVTVGAFAIAKCQTTKRQILSNFHNCQNDKHQSADCQAKASCGHKPDAVGVRTGLKAKCLRELFGTFNFGSAVLRVLLCVRHRCFLQTFQARKPHLGVFDNTVYVRACDWVFYCDNLFLGTVAGVGRVQRQKCEMGLLENLPACFLPSLVYVEASK